MKTPRRFLPGWIPLLALLAVGCRGTRPTAPTSPATQRSPATGAYTPIATGAPGVAAAATFALAAQSTSMPPGADGKRPRLRLQTLLRAEQQVVAGMNYRLQMKVTVDGTLREVEAIVGWQAWRTPDPYQLTSWTWK